MQDINDNYPEFTCNPYLATVPENAEPQHSIIQIQATDRDSDKRPLKYFFGPSMGNMASIFSIDPETGWIVLLTQLDRETRDQYNLTVIVSDNPPQNILRKTSDQVSLTSTTSVVITVADFNDSPPKFERDSYITAVNEGALRGTILVTLITKDADKGSNSDVAYFISDGDQLGQFAVGYLSKLK